MLELQSLSYSKNNNPIMCKAIISGIEIPISRKNYIRLKNTADKKKVSFIETETDNIFIIEYIPSY